MMTGMLCTTVIRKQIILLLVDDKAHRPFALILVKKLPFHFINQTRALFTKAIF